MRTSAVEVSIHATSPLLGTGAGAAAGAAVAAAGAPAAAGAAGAPAGGVAAGAAAAGAGVAAGAALSCAIAPPPMTKAPGSATKVDARFHLCFPLIQLRRRLSRR